MYDTFMVSVAKLRWLIRQSNVGSAAKKTATYYDTPFMLWIGARPKTHLHQPVLCSVIPRAVSDDVLYCVLWPSFRQLRELCDLYPHDILVSTIAPLALNLCDDRLTDIRKTAIKHVRLCFDRIRTGVWNIFCSFVFRLWSLLHLHSRVSFTRMRRNYKSALHPRVFY